LDTAETQGIEVSNSPKGKHMKSRSIKMAVLSGMLALFVAAALPSWASDSHQMKNGPTLTTKEAKALIETAKTPKEHLKLAQYFSQQADQSEAEAKDHDEMIEAYRRNSAPQAIKAPGGVGTIQHCEFLAKSDREMAKAFREMAAAHEEMAKEAAK
jgi:hypothetical protein